jgi:hypothetical protein
VKAGRWCHGFHAATTDLDVINAWWAANPGFGVGVACAPAGLVVIDIDAHHDTPPERRRLLPGIPIPEQVDLTGLSSGFHTMELLAALRGQPSPAEDASTLRVRTPSGGLHVWYRASVQHTFTSSAGSAGGRAALGWQVDVRAHGGYIVAPGTTTAAGAYTPAGRVRLPAPLPDWLAAELIRTGHRTQQTAAPQHRPFAVPQRGRLAVTAAGGSNPADRALHTVLTAVTDCAALPAGAGFTAKLNRAAYTAGGLVAAGCLTEGEAARRLQEAADLARPGQQRRSQATIRSGLAAGAARPLQPEGGRQ